MYSSRGDGSRVDRKRILSTYIRKGPSALISPRVAAIQLNAAAVLPVKESLKESLNATECPYPHGTRNAPTWVFTRHIPMDQHYWVTDCRPPRQIQLSKGRSRTFKDDPFFEGGGNPLTSVMRSCLCVFACSHTTSCDLNSPDIASARR